MNDERWAAFILSLIIAVLALAVCGVVFVFMVDHGAFDITLPAERTITEVES